MTGHVTGGWCYGPCGFCDLDWKRDGWALYQAGPLRRRGELLRVFGDRRLAVQEATNRAENEAERRGWKVTDIRLEESNDEANVAPVDGNGHYRYDAEFLVRKVRLDIRGIS